MRTARPARRIAAALMVVALLVSACTSDTSDPETARDDGSEASDEGSDAPADDPGENADETGADAPPDGPSSVALWRYFNECASQFEGVTEIGETTDVCAVQQILANQWNADNPGLQVETTALVWPGIVELNAALSAGNPPEIMSLHAFRIPAYASVGTLTPLTSYFEEAGIDVDDMMPSVREAVTYNGEVYALPFDIHGILWHINLDLWEQAGLVDGSGNPQIPVGRAEFEAACEQVLDATDTGEMVDVTLQVIPAKYNTNTELTADISTSKTTLDFDLKSE
jgi:ABC-type glycerol-3-phosphate transport system substrate-binding protein